MFRRERSAGADFLSAGFQEGRGSRPKHQNFLWIDYKHLFFLWEELRYNTTAEKQKNSKKEPGAKRASGHEEER